MHFLIDTNIFIDYIKANKDDELIELIIHLSKNGKIYILASDIQKLEWDKKKKSTLEYITKTYKITTSLTKGELTKQNLKTELKNIENKIQKIDNLFLIATSFKTSAKTKADVIDRKLAGIAPFHDQKTKTDIDALIYFSSIAYLRKKKLKELAFVTKDSGDFGDPQNKEQILHPQLIVESIDIHYFTSLYRCFDKLNSRLSESFPKEERQDQIFVLRRDGNNLLDYLYNVIKSYRAKMPFLPTDILARIDPFRVTKSQDNYSYYSSGTIYTNNTELIEFFDSIDYSSQRFKLKSKFKNTKTNLEQLSFILLSLNQNMVHNIAHVRKLDRVSIKINLNIECKCGFCTLRSLNFQTLLDDFPVEDDDITKALVYFQLGKFYESHQIFKSIYENAIKADNNIAAYRMLLNLFWTSEFIDIHRSQKNKYSFDIKNNLEERTKVFLSAINADELDRELALFLKGTSMIDFYKLSIKEELENIRTHYQSQLSGNYSSNSNLQNLLHAFSHLESNTVFNGMAYTKYSDFGNICKDFIEGIFMSLAMNQYQSSRLEFVDDFLLERFLIYGNTDHLIRCFNRFIKKQIKYKTEDKFAERNILNFLNQSDSTIEYFSNSKYLEGGDFFYRIFWNIVLLLAIVDFDQQFIIECYSNIPRFLNMLPKRESHQLHHLASLIHSKGSVLKKEHLEPLLKFVIDNPKLHDEDIFLELGSNNDYKFEIDLSSDEMNKINLLFFHKCESCDKYHNHLLYSLFCLLPVKTKKAVTLQVTSRLKDNFDSELYYMAVMGDIIEHESYFSNYINSIGNLVKSTKSYLHGEQQFPQLNKLMNLVFKAGINLSKVQLEKFSGLSDYYDWLVNMEEFDYKKFEPIWLLQYSTRYYLKKAFLIPQVKDYVRNYLRENHQPKLAYYYTQNVV